MSEEAFSFSIPSRDEEAGSRGFTLVELLVTLVIAMVLLGGLLLSFQNQYGHYSFQSKKADAVQDMDAVLRAVRDDLRSALVIGGTPQVLITPDPYTTPSAATTDLKIEVWEPNLEFWGASGESLAVKASRRASNKFRAQRHWRFDPAAKALRLDRNTRDGGDSPTEILSNVTWFQVWQGEPYSGLADAPPADPYGLVVYDEKGNQIRVPQYTVLIEVEVPVGYRGGLKTDVHGNATATPRVRRYVIVYPESALSEP